MATSKNTIKLNETAVFETSDGRLFFEKIGSENKIRLGKNINVSDLPTYLVGFPYGSVFEAQGGKLVPVQGGLLPYFSMTDQELNQEDDLERATVISSPNSGCIAMEDGDKTVTIIADNRNYVDSNTAQKVSQATISGFKEEGLSGSEIIKHLVQGSTTWETKTEFSKAKYIKKKQQKYLPRIRVLRATARMLCQCYFQKRAPKIGNLREDALAQMLMYGNIYAGAQVLVVDTCMGLLTGAIAERLGGYGRILTGFSGQQLAGDILQRLNLNESALASIIPYPFHFLHQLETPEDQLALLELSQLEVLSPEEQTRRDNEVAERKKNRTEEQQLRHETRKAEMDQLRARKLSDGSIRDLLRTPSDCLLIASSFDPKAMLFKMLPFLGGSKPFVIHCEYLEPLCDIFQTLKLSGEAINLQLTTTWTREYQVLPRRTHPEMKMSSCGGFLLYGIKVLLTPRAIVAAYLPPCPSSPQNGQKKVKAELLMEQ